MKCVQSIDLKRRTVYRRRDVSRAAVDNCGAILGRRPRLLKMGWTVAHWLPSVAREGEWKQNQSQNRKGQNTTRDSITVQRVASNSRPKSLVCGKKIIAFLGSGSGAGY